MHKAAWLLFSLFLFQIRIAAQKPIKIACVGSSLTYGLHMANRSKNSFPIQLQYLLGNKYAVINYGVPGAIVFQGYNEQVKNVVSAHADIIIINFGSYETGENLQNRRADFEASYASIIDSLRMSNKHARIILLKEPPAFNSDSTIINPRLIKHHINPAIERLAFKYNAEIIDLYSTFIDRADLFPDSLHLSSLGATIIARKLYDVVRLPDRKTIFPENALPPKRSVSSFYGFEEISFTFNGRDCRIVKPKRVATGTPWIWRARFWGHEPQTDIALLERGFHVVYCDVAELYGNKEAIKIWDSFYDWTRGLGFSDKPVLEAMSRGAIYAYNWALAHPDRVAAIYADAPVLDLKSWPGGKGIGPGSANDWEVFKKDYDLSEAAALQFRGSPLDRTSEIITSSFPILHVVGDADEVVPLQENTAPFEEQLLKAGRQITVIHKAGIKHHPHSLPNPAPIVAFILRATGYKTNFANLPAPGAEYRSAAGWREGTDWWKQYEDINDQLLASKEVDILFIGNSITQGIGGNRRNVTYKPGKRIFDSIFSEYKYVSAGISGDRTQHILWRLQHSSLKNIPVKCIVLAIGVNNFSDDTPEEIVEGIRSATLWLRKFKPDTKVLLIGPLPAGVNDDHHYRKEYEAVHRILKNLDHHGAIYMPLSDQFILDNGVLDPQFYSSDGIHLLEKGYAQWAMAIRSAIINSKLLIDGK